MPEQTVTGTSTTTPYLTVTTTNGTVTPTTIPAPTAGPEPVVQAPSQPAASPSTPAPAETPTAPPSGKRSLEDSLATLDEATRKFVLDELRSARNEAKNLREREKNVRTEITTAVAKAMGIEQAPPDPATLTQQLESQTTAARQAQVELAVFRAAQAAGGDPNALLDSRSFMRGMADVDANDLDAVTERVKAAVAANPNLSAQPVRRVPGPNPAIGASAGGAPDLETEIAAAQKAGDWARVIHLQNQKLNGQIGR